MGEEKADFKHVIRTIVVRKAVEWVFGNHFFTRAIHLFALSSGEYGNLR